MSAKSASSRANPYQEYVKSLVIGDQELSYYDVRAIAPSKYDRLPYCIRILLESAVRNCDLFQVKPDDVENLLNWEQTQDLAVDIPFRPSRVILQDFTGVPALVDFAAMRDAVKKLGGDPKKVNPVVPVDLVIDHSIQVDVFGSDDALEKNQQLEFERNEERFQFLKWGAKALSNMQIIPPGSGIVHQVNLEYLARVVFNSDHVLYPDSIVGTDSHTTMINGLGVVGWGVGGIEAEAVMLGQAISMVLPKVVGYKLTGSIGSLATSTDVVLTVTKNLRQLGVVGKFVEFFGPGVSQLSIADRATISNMCPEYGATIGYFPVDDMSLKYLKQTGRSKDHISVIKSYLNTTSLFRDYNDTQEDPVFSEVIELDLSSVVPSLSGPKRPHDRVPVSNMKEDFTQCISNKLGFKGFGIEESRLKDVSEFLYGGKTFSITHGSVLISAITSCTNTSNPSVMLGAGLLARKAVEKGLGVSPYIKTSLSPGSGVVTYYLKESGVIPYMNQLGFNVVGYGCMTCIGNSGPLPEEVVQAVEDNDLVAVGVLSGNRNFEGRINPYTRANYLASPPLCIAYAIAGTVLINFQEDPLGFDQAGSPVFLKDIWPSRLEVQEVERQYVLPVMFEETYSKVTEGNKTWNDLQSSNSILYPWEVSSTYIQCPPFFDDLSLRVNEIEPIHDAFALLVLGDSVTTDHISPAGSISRNSPAARYLSSKGLTPRQFNSYGSRRGNDEVMSRGTFANIRLMNKLVGKPGPKTIHIPSGDVMDIYDAAIRYMKDKQSLIILAGRDYGSGSSRDWAAKGPWILGVKAVLAESYERIHRSNLVGMGILPLQYKNNQNAEVLRLSGTEMFTIEIPSRIKPKQSLDVKISTGSSFSVICCIQTEVEATYYHNGGILNYMIRRLSV